VQETLSLYNAESLGAAAQTTSIQPNQYSVYLRMTTSSDPHSITVLECFDRPLPWLHRGKLEYDKVKASSVTTALAVPPRVLLCSSGEYYSQRADDYLKLQSTRQSSLTNQTVGTEFSQISLDNEQSLVLASDLYILKPILSILQCKYGKDFRVTCEAKPKKDELENGESATRVDLVFRSTKGEQEVIFAIEYKRREQIRYNDFKMALLPKDASSNEIAEKAAASMNELNDSFLKDNGLNTTKQVTTYADQFRCPYIALLNWDHLQLLEFNKLREAAATGTKAGPTAKLTWVSETRHSEGEHVHAGNIRKVLLGFAIEAFEAWALNQPPG
jgi:hypothetical protein